MQIRIPSVFHSASVDIPVELSHVLTNASKASNVAVEFECHDRGNAACILCDLNIEHSWYDLERRIREIFCIL